MEPADSKSLGELDVTGADRRNKTRGKRRDKAHTDRYNFYMTSKRLAQNLLACSLLLAVAASAAAPASPETTGLAVGQKAPEFTLKDQNDRDVSLATLLKKGPVALVFFRSADW